jgi:hypothetical protein
MKNTLKYGVLVFALLAPMTAFAEMGDPSPNATGIGGVNDSAEMSPALSSLRLCGPGTHSVYFRNDEGRICAPNRY